MCDKQYSASVVTQFDFSNTRYKHKREKNMGINKQWFQTQLLSKQISQRGLAKLLGIGPSAITNIFNDKRKLTNEEANKIAGLLSLPVTEILRQAGIEVTEDVRSIPITGYVDGEALVHLLSPGTHDRVLAPADVPRNAYCLQIRHLGAQFDGWHAFVGGERLPADELVDRAALVSLHDGRMITGVIRRGYKAKTHNLSTLPYLRTLENQLVDWASPILWLKPN